MVLSTYYLLVASKLATGAATLESTLLPNDNGAVSFVTTELNLVVVAIALSTYYFVVAS